jgi:hypothetical protein
MSVAITLQVMRAPPHTFKEFFSTNVIGNIVAGWNITNLS